MENKKYELFIKLLNFNKDKYSSEEVFEDFISIFAISLSNEVDANQENSNRYEKIYSKYEKEEKSYFYALSAELVRLFYKEKEPYDILGEIYQKISDKNYLRIRNTNLNLLQKVGKKLQGVVNINKQSNNGKMIEMNCGSGAMILAYASILKIFKIDYKRHLQVVAIDTEISNIFMTYIQMYFYDIAATVILIDAKTNQETMRLYTPKYEQDKENLMVA